MKCHNPETGKLIAGFELGILTEQDRMSFEKHIMECQYCFQNLYRTAPITLLMRQGKLAPKGKYKLLKEPSTVHQPRRFRKIWIYAASGAAAVFALVFFLMQLSGPIEKTERLRGQDEISVLVISPVGNVREPKEFRWKAVPESQSYIVKLYTEAGELKWEEKATKTNVVVPKAIQNILIPGKTYFWQVESKTGQSSSIKSKAIRFTIIR